MIKLEKVIDVKTGQVVDVIGLDELEKNLFNSAKRKMGQGEFINTIVTLMENKHYYRETTGSSFAREAEGVSVSISRFTKEDGHTTEVIEFPFVIKDTYDGFIVFKDGSICPIDLTDGEERLVPVSSVSFSYTRQPVSTQADASYDVIMMTDDLVKSIEGHNADGLIMHGNDNCIISYFLHEEDK